MNVKFKFEEEKYRVRVKKELDDTYTALLFDEGGGGPVHESRGHAKEMTAYNECRSEYLGIDY